MYFGVWGSLVATMRRAGEATRGGSPRQPVLASWQSAQCLRGSAAILPPRRSSACCWPAPYRYRLRFRSEGLGHAYAETMGALDA